MYRHEWLQGQSLQSDKSLTKVFGVQVQEAFPEDPWFHHEWGEIMVLQNRQRDAHRHLQAAAALFASQLEKVTCGYMTPGDRCLAACSVGEDMTSAICKLALTSTASTIALQQHFASSKQSLALLCHLLQP